MQDLDKEDMRDLIKKAGLLKPSEGFLQKVMGEINVTLSHKEIVYQPLISKKGWMIIGAVIISTIGAMFLMSGDSASIFDKINVYLPEFGWRTNFMTNLKVYDTTVYGILFLTLMFFVQIGFIKKKIDANLSP